MKFGFELGAMKCCAGSVPAASLADAALFDRQRRCRVLDVEVSLDAVLLGLVRVLACSGDVRS
jgi:hypothetical protein